MGQLRDSLSNAHKLVAALATMTDDFKERLTSVLSESDSFLKGGEKGVSELGIYVKEKLKKQKIPYEQVKNNQLKTIMDPNIKRYLDGLQFMINETAKFRPDFEALAVDKTID